LRFLAGTRVRTGSPSNNLLRTASQEPSPLPQPAARQQTLCSGSSHSHHRRHHHHRDHSAALSCRASVCCCLSSHPRRGRRRDLFVPTPDFAPTLARVQPPKHHRHHSLGSLSITITTKTRIHRTHDLPPHGLLLNGTCASCATAPVPQTFVPALLWRQHHQIRHRRHALTPFSLIFNGC